MHQKRFLGQITLLFSLVLQISAVQYCPTSEFKSWSGNCYSFHSYDYQSWQNAQSNCEKKGDNVNLVSIHSKEENDFVYDEMMSHSGYSDYWIGLYKDQDSSGNIEDRYKWSDGTVRDYTNWAPDEPNDVGGTENCVEVYYGSYPRQWNDHSCTHYTTSYVCKAPYIDGWQAYGGNEYYISAGLGDNGPNWYESRAWCMENGGDLASITSDEESNAIMGWAKKMDFKGSLWNGLNKLDGMKTAWHWADGSDMFGFNRWQVGYPRDEGIGGLCGYQHADDPEGKWRNTHCNAVTHGFICKRKQGDTVPKTTLPPITAGGYCPHGFTEVGDKCFRLHVRDTHTGHTWEEAMEYCRKYSFGYLPDLASINNELEQAYITSLMQEVSYGLWIGLYRIGDGNQDWRWTDNSQNMYKSWAPLEPSSYTDRCVEMRFFPGPVGGWASLGCEKKRGFVCQVFKNPSVTINTPPVTTAHQCTGDYIPFWDACYKFDSSLLSWNDASSRCSGEGGQLVSIHSAAENAVVQIMAIEKGATIWLGLRDSSNNGLYSWSDHTVVTYANWGKGEPKPEEGGGCVRLRGGDGTWEDANCLSKTGYVCKKNDKGIYTTPKHIEGTCPDRTDWVAHGSNCYYFQPVAYETWQGALEKCVKKFPLATLTSIHNQAENDWIYNQIMNIDDNPNQVWIGMYQKQSRGFGWVDQSTVQYENWAAGEPNGLEGEQCVELYTTYFPKKWNDNVCSEYRGFVCKAPKVPHPPTIAPVPGICPTPEWTSLGAKCYLFQPDIHLTWMDARRRCSEEGGPGSELVSITGDGENLFVEAEMYARSHSQVHENYWLGMGKKKAGSPYHWVDGNTAVYTNWEQGEPSNPHGNDENCVEMYFDNGRWNDIDCDVFRGFACKADKVPLEGSSGGLTSGGVAGVVIGVLMAVLIITIIAIVLLTKNNIISNPATRVREVASGFSNPFYGSSGSHVAEDKQGIENPQMPDDSAA